MGPRERGAGPEAIGEAREVAPPQQEGPNQPRATHPGKVRRQAPEVTREWSAGRAAPRPSAFPWPLVLMAGLLALILLGLIPGRFLVSPAGLAVAGSLSALCLAAYLRAVASETPDHRIVSRALSDIQLDRDPRLVIMHLQEARLRGRAGLRRDIAVRCLEGAGRHRRLEGRLLREGERWLRGTRDELEKEDVA